MNGLLIYYAEFEFLCQKNGRQEHLRALCMLVDTHSLNMALIKFGIDVRLIFFNSWIVYFLFLSYFSLSVFFTY